MRQNAIVLSHYSQHALLGLSLSGTASNPLPCVACRCFARRGANLSPKQMKMDSEATADAKCRESELTFLSSMYMPSHGMGREKNPTFSISPLIAAHSQTNMRRGQRSACCIPGKVARRRCCTRPRDNTQTRPHTRLKTRCLKAEC